MSWVVIVWSMMAASSLTLAAIHLSVWFRQRGDHRHLLFSCLAVSAAAFGWFELLLMQSTTAMGHAATLRWAQVPLSAVVLSIVGFVYFFFDVRGGMRWLALAICAVRLVSLALNFTTGVNINYREETGLVRLVLWGGESVATPVGVPNPWTVLPQASNVMLLFLVIGAAVTMWRRGDSTARRRALVVGGSLVLCVGTQLAGPVEHLPLVRRVEAARA